MANKVTIQVNDWGNIVGVLLDGPVADMANITGDPLWVGYERVNSQTLQCNNGRWWMCDPNSEESQESHLVIPEPKASQRLGRRQQEFDRVLRQCAINGWKHPLTFGEWLLQVYNEVIA